MITIENVRIESTASEERLVGNVHGRELWFAFPKGYDIEPRAEPFISIALFFGMSLGQDIEVEPGVPLSPSLVANLDRLQSLLRQWNPDFSRVRIKAELSEPKPRSNIVLSSFSGGVDSCYTFIQHRDEITHLLLINSFDRKGGDQDFGRLKAKMGETAAEFGKTLLPIETNGEAVVSGANMSFSYVHGGFLCSLAAYLGVARYYIPSSYTYRELKPWGSHPLLDPLWSTAVTEIVHDGVDARRSEKTVAIAAHPDVLKELQVCWYNKTSNCGRCSKCVRTLLVLDMIGVRESPIPYSDPLKLIDRLKVDSDLSAAFVWDIMEFARRRGATAVEKAAYEHLRRYLVRRNLEGLVKAAIGRRGMELVERIRKPGWAGRKVILLDPDNFQ